MILVSNYNVLDVLRNISHSNTMGTEINRFEIYVMDLERAEFFYKKIFNATFFDMNMRQEESR